MSNQSLIVYELSVTYKAYVAAPSPGEAAQLAQEVCKTEPSPHVVKCSTLRQMPSPEDFLPGWDEHTPIYHPGKDDLTLSELL